MLDRRTILAVALSFLVLFGSQWLAVQMGWIKPAPPSSMPKSQTALGKPETGHTAPGTTTLDAMPGSAGTTPGAASTNGDGNGTAVSGWAAAPDSIVSVDHALYTARFRTRGARLLSVTLKQFASVDSNRVALAADVESLFASVGAFES